MPYWTVEQEKLLLDLVKEGKTLEAVAEALNRSPEAIAKKLKRMRMPIPEKCLAKISENKVTKDTPTTTPKLEPLKLEQLPSPNEAMGLMWAAIRRLQDPDVGKEEAKKLRLIIQGVKSYIHLEADYVIRIRHVETGMLIQAKHIATHLQLQINQSKSSGEKAKLEQELREVQQHIKEMVEMGIQEPRKEPKETKALE